MKTTTEYASWSADSSAGLERVIMVWFDLVLQEPAHFGAGDHADSTDSPLLTTRTPDGVKPLLPGSSLAGAMRSLLRRRFYGSRLPDHREESTGPIGQLFGGSHGDNDGFSSSILFDDAIGIIPQDAGVTIRTRVSIDPEHGTAAAGALFTWPYWEAGTTFPCRFQVVFHEDADHALILNAITTLVDCLARGEIQLGAGRSRGTGSVRGANWRVADFDLRSGAGFGAWLRWDGESKVGEPSDDPVAALGGDSIPDARATLKLVADFSLESDLLLRDGAPSVPAAPDMVQLFARTAEGARLPVISGSSIAGAMRARAGQILSHLGFDQARASFVVESLFGADKASKSLTASRLRTREAVVEGATVDLVQQRVSIDRFTGGSFPGALFDELPAFGAAATTVRLEFVVEDPSDAEVGLVLLLVKDLWTGHLPLGGSVNAGRGRLIGRRASLDLRSPERQGSWVFDASLPNMGLQDATGQELQGFVNAIAQSAARQQPS